MMDQAELDDRTYNLLFAIRRSVRYHERRRRFYEIWNTVTVTLGVLGGSSAFAAFIGGWGWWPAAFSAAVAVLSSMDLAVGTTRRADRHGDLMRQFIGLEQRFAYGRNLENDEYGALVHSRLDIEAGEPTVLRLLDVMCHFEVLRSLGDARKHPDIPWWRRKLAHCLSQTDYALNLAQPKAA